MAEIDDVDALLARVFADAAAELDADAELGELVWAVGGDRAYCRYEGGVSTMVIKHSDGRADSSYCFAVDYRDLR